MPGQGLAVAIVAVTLINGAFSFWQEYRAEETMAALQRLPTVTLAMAMARATDGEAEHVGAAPSQCRDAWLRRGHLHRHGNALFRTAPIGYKAWPVVLPFALAMMVLEEVRKAVFRWREGSNVVSSDTANVRGTVPTGS